MAAGAWTGHLLADSLGEEHLREAFVPRKGHLLEISSPAGMPPLRHGLMELGYTHVSCACGVSDHGIVT